MPSRTKNENRNLAARLAEWIVEFQHEYPMQYELEDKLFLMLEEWEVRDAE